MWVGVVAGLEDALREEGRVGVFGGGSNSCSGGGKGVVWVCLVVGVEDALREGGR